MRFLLICVANIFLIACNNSGQLQETNNDQTRIITKILDDTYLSNEFIKKPDIIYLIKSGNIIKDWPSKTNKYKLVYIERTKKDENLVDLSPISFEDKRTRIDFSRLILNKNTADVTIVLYQFHKLNIYDYKLKYENEQWVIFKFKKRTFLS